MIDFVKILTDVGKIGYFFDACILDTCCVTYQQDKVTYFVMNADNLTMRCREEDVEANVRLQRKFTPSCNVQKLSFEM